MTQAKVEAARDEAQRFIAKAEDALREVKGAGATLNWWPSVGTKMTGALRRASLDLTRVLAEMRKP